MSWGDVVRIGSRVIGAVAGGAAGGWVNPKAYMEGYSAGATISDSLVHEGQPKLVKQGVLNPYNSNAGFMKDPTGVTTSMVYQSPEQRDIDKAFALSDSVNNMALNSGIGNKKGGALSKGTPVTENTSNSALTPVTNPYTDATQGWAGTMGNTSQGWNGVMDNKSKGWSIGGGSGLKTFNVNDVSSKINETNRMMNFNIPSIGSKSKRWDGLIGNNDSSNRLILKSTSSGQINLSSLLNNQ